jgi:hypothetical protein
VGGSDRNFSIGTKYFINHQKLEERMVAKNSSGTSSLDEIEIVLSGIGDMLRNNNLSVPKYQRSYAWKDQNALDLFQDISNAISEGTKEYFLGSIVISQKNSERPEVVDGQQRLATTSILLAAIRDYFSEHGDTERATEIHKEYLVRTNLETLEVIPRLYLNENDHNFYCKKVISWPGSPERSFSPSKESHSRIEKSAQIAKAHVEKIATITNAPTKRLVDLVNYLRAKAKVIWVSVPDDANAFTIFETLNDRGLPLAISDLLKNYLFYLSGDRINEVQQMWVSMIGILEAVDSEELAVTYIRQFWSSVYGITRERELYNKIKETITSKKQAVDLANKLMDSARLYAAILNPSHEFWNEYGPTAKEHMVTLNGLGMIQIRSLLLAALSSFSVIEARKALHLMVVWSVRFLIFGGLGGGALESQYCQRAVDIRIGKITSTKELLNAMKEIVPTDSQFRKAFENATVSKDYLARYYLRVLENQLQNKAEPELIPNSNEEIVTLEHILPESPSLAWKNIEPDVAKAYYKRLGNMALLTHRINSDIGNEGFTSKRPFYKPSDYKLTNSLITRDVWGVEQIEERQKELADLAIRAWPNKI